VDQDQQIGQERVFILVKESGEGCPIDARDGIEATCPGTLDAGGELRWPGWDKHLSLFGQDEQLPALRSNGGNGSRPIT
jgi:hypothetical protein